jgi:chromate reductase
MPKLLFVPGSLRTASSSRALSATLAQRLSDAADATLADPGRLPHYNADLTDDPEVERFKQQVHAADGVVFITPEYNYSVPGVLKNAIDWASRPAFGSVFLDKPCFVITVSGGATGGVRAQAHLKYVLNGMLAKVFLTKEVVVAQANKKTQDGEFVDETVLAFSEEGLRSFIASL